MISYNGLRVGEGASRDLPGAFAYTLLPAGGGTQNFNN